MRYIAHIIGTFGFIGHLRPAPGTYGSLAAAAIWWFLVPSNLPIQLTIILVVSVLGIWSSSIIERNVGVRDPALVVVDEVAGMWCALIMGSATLWYYVAAFVIFRLLDIVKPWPIRRFQNLSGGWGIMADDLAAGAVTLAIITLLHQVL